MTTLFSFFLLPQHFFLPNAVGPRTRPVTISARKTGMIPKQKTVPISLNLHVRIPKGLVG